MRDQLAIFLSSAGIVNDGTAREGVHSFKDGGPMKKKQKSLNGPVSSLVKEKSAGA